MKIGIEKLSNALNLGDFSRLLINSNLQWLNLVYLK